MSLIEWVAVIPGLRIHMVPKCGFASINAAISMAAPRYEAIDASGDGRRIQVVRNPLERLVSAWAFLSPEVPFEGWGAEVLRNPHANPHTRSQVWFSGPFQPELWPVEELSQRWELLRMDVPALLALGARNASQHQPWAEHYTPALRAMAEEVYAEDQALYLSALT